MHEKKRKKRGGEAFSVVTNLSAIAMVILLI